MCKKYYGVRMSDDMREGKRARPQDEPGRCWHERVQALVEDFDNNAAMHESITFIV